MDSKIDGWWKEESKWESWRKLCHRGGMKSEDTYILTVKLEVIRVDDKLPCVTPAYFWGQCKSTEILTCLCILIVRLSVYNTRTGLENIIFLF